MGKRGEYHGSRQGGETDSRPVLLSETNERFRACTPALYEQAEHEDKSRHLETAGAEKGFSKAKNRGAATHATTLTSTLLMLFFRQKKMFRDLYVEFSFLRRINREGKGPGGTRAREVLKALSTSSTSARSRIRPTLTPRPRTATASHAATPSYRDSANSPELSNTTCDLKSHNLNTRPYAV